MSKISQKECVFAAVTALLEEQGRKHELDSKQPITLSKTDRATVVSMVVAARSEMQLSAEADAKFDTEPKFKDYVVGLVNNWLRKDTRLNGGSKYITKNPGSRAGQGDDIMKSLKALRTTVADKPEQAALVDAEIEKRAAEIQATKVKPTTINIDALPEHLRHLVK
jgi:hypothetical protein